MSVKLSIVIPVYNAEKYIRACLDSLCGQSLKEIEIICVNDGSTDNSLKILQEYAQKDKRVIIADQENKGANAARKTGYLCSSGEYFTLVDADDWLEPNLYETVIKKMEQENADCGVFNWYVENGKAQMNGCRLKKILCIIWNLPGKTPWMTYIFWPLMP